jgi:hypothetical protein
VVEPAALILLAVKTTGLDGRWLDQAEVNIVVVVCVFLESGGNQRLHTCVDEQRRLRPHLRGTA